MAATGRIERRLAIAIALTALLPLLGATELARSAVGRASERFYVPEVGARLDEALGLHQELARADKAALREAARALALDPGLIAAASGEPGGGLEVALGRILAEDPRLVSLSVVEDGRTRGEVRRAAPLDAEREVSLEIRRPLGAGAPGADAAPLPVAPPAGGEDERGEPPDGDEPEDRIPGRSVVAVFALPRARYERLESMSAFVTQWQEIAARRKSDEAAYLAAFGALLALTIVVSGGVGIFVARGVARRVVRLADATRRVGAGDLSIRVAEEGEDEVTDLAQSFNRMLSEVETSRSRIEYLQRIAAWQGMARRLAHEIKNPLTPIQLAVEEIHQRYAGDDAAYRRALDATLDIVRAEVGTLRRLVGEFSDFARLPEARPEPDDLAAFLREEAARAGFLPEPGQGDGARPRVVVSFQGAEVAAPAALDRQLLHRALANLVENAVHALRDAGRGDGRVTLTLRRLDGGYALDVDDDGPGLPDELGDRVFDPYVSTKADGTGLGLSIVKKIVVEHGGVVTLGRSELGGARVRLRLPALGASTAAVLQGAGTP